MGLSGPKNKRKINEDPNNTRWSRNETTFGQRMLRAQGWEPGQNLGAKDAAHASYHTAASSAPIKVVVKDDFLGLGAKIRQKQSDECTGLDVFKDLLGRLNGKSEESIEKERKVRSDIKTNLYVENKFGLMRFVSGGLLVGDQMQDLVTKKEEVELKTEPEDVRIKEEQTSDSEKVSSKKDKKSKKRKVEDALQDEVKEKSRDKKRRKKADADKGDESSDESSSKKKKKSKKSKSASESDDDSAKSKDKKKKRKEKMLKEAEAAESAATSDAEDAEKRRKREKKEKKRRKQEAAAVESTASSTPMVVDTPEASGTATPVETGTSTPTAMSARHYARSRNIASKRQAIENMKSLNQIFMVKPV